MDWSEWRSSAGVAANLTSLAFKFAETVAGKHPAPELHLALKQTGGGPGSTSLLGSPSGGIRSRRSASTCSRRSRGGGLRGAGLQPERRATRRRTSVLDLETERERR